MTMMQTESRKAFEKVNAIPVDAKWNEEKQAYKWWGHPNVDHPVNDLWLTWQEAVDWQATHTKYAEPGARHEWDESGERCLKCGDKDWFAGPVCEETKVRTNPPAWSQGVPEGIADQIERVDWTPEEALKWYASGKHFDVVNGRTRIIDSGSVASNALKHLSSEYLEMKGDAELSELRDAVNGSVQAHGGELSTSPGNGWVRCEDRLPTERMLEAAMSERDRQHPENAKRYLSHVWDRMCEASNHLPDAYGVIDDEGQISYSVRIMDNVTARIAYDLCQQHVNDAAGSGVEGSGKWVVRPLRIGERPAPPTTGESK